eukprot:TRINITY_DN9490_c0_g1_i1.p1 TRINITY_DN9490_c0_g1~~TRINITY_DN9490_c0_g1_i1.p1  ORF type:complete len:576 (+),score=175.55 TRINITY_DN9490_c0_g1_i1:220-1728(+)
MSSKTSTPTNTVELTRFLSLVDRTLQQPSISVNLEICDMINKNRDAYAPLLAKHLRTVLKSNKTPMTTLCALALIESCTNNCANNFIIDISNKEFVKKMVTLVEGKKRSSLFSGNRQKMADDSNTAISEEKRQIREQSLMLLDTWGSSYGEVYPAFKTAVEKLKEKGLTFPSPNKQELATTMEQEHAKRTYIKRGGSRIRVPVNVLEDIEACKQTLAVALPLLEAHPRGCDPALVAKDTALATAIADLTTKKEKLANFITELCQNCAGDEQLVSALAVLTNKMDRIIDRYGRRIKVQKPEPAPGSMARRRSLSANNIHGMLSSSEGIVPPSPAFSTLLMSSSSPSSPSPLSFSSPLAISGRPTRSDSLSSSLGDDFMATFERVEAFALRPPPTPTTSRPTRGYSMTSTPPSARTFSFAAAPVTPVLSHSMMSLPPPSPSPMMSRYVPTRKTSTYDFGADTEHYILDAPISPTLLGINMLEKLTFSPEEKSRMWPSLAGDARC